MQSQLNGKFPSKTGHVHVLHPEHTKVTGPESAREFATARKRSSGPEHSPAESNCGHAIKIQF